MQTSSGLWKSNQHSVVHAAKMKFILLHFFVATVLCETTEKGTGTSQAQGNATVSGQKIELEDGHVNARYMYCFECDGNLMNIGLTFAGQLGHEQVRVYKCHNFSNGVPKKCVYEAKQCNSVVDKYGRVWGRGCGSQNQYGITKCYTLAGSTDWKTLYPGPEGVYPPDDTWNEAYLCLCDTWQCNKEAPKPKFTFYDDADKDRTGAASHPGPRLTSVTGVVVVMWLGK